MSSSSGDSSDAGSHDEQVNSPESQSNASLADEANAENGLHNQSGEKSNDGNQSDESDERSSVQSGNDDDQERAQAASDDQEELSAKDDDEDMPQVKAKKARTVASSDSEESGDESRKSPTHEDLFGDADDVRTSSSDEEAEEKDQSAAIAEESPPQDDDDEEMDESRRREVQPEETILNAEIPKISVDLGNQLHFVKFPNFLSVEPRPFDPETYEDEVDEDEILDEEGRSRLKLKVENTIRWHYVVDEDGNLKRESNAKIVRWSDGSLSLYVGSEVFDVHTHPLQGDHHHLFVRQGTGLQGRSVFRTKLTFRPHSTESFTHRKITLSMADKTSKTQKVKVLPAVGKNPEALKQELIKKEEERMRASARRESQQRRMRERTHGTGGRALSAAYLEPDRGGDWDDADVSLSAIKNRYKAGAKEILRGRRPLSDEEEEVEEAGDSDADSRSGRKNQSKQSGPAKRIIESDEEEESEGASIGKGSDRSPAEKSEPKRRVANVITESDED